MASQVTTPTPPYTPDEETKLLLSECENRYERAHSIRQPHEGQWYVNSAMLRGNQWVQWDAQAATLTIAPVASNRVRRSFNLLLPKVSGRRAKFLKNRPKPEVRAASQDIKDILDARMTTKALEYLWRSLGVELCYKETLSYATELGHGYLWVGWDAEKLGRVQITDETTGEKTTKEAKLGDISIEVGSPFELLVEDPGITRIGLQPRIWRSKVRSLDYIHTRFPENGKYVKAEAVDDVQALHYEKSIASLSPQSSVGNLGLGSTATPPTEEQSACVKEMFEHPSGEFPKGRYIVWATGVLLKKQDELPYEMYTLANPYPVVDFPDLALAGQYWVTTVLEQMVPLQRQYNVLRSMLEEHVRKMSNPKILVAKQHMLAKGAWGTSAGEIIEYVAHPNIPEPRVLAPANIASDVWRLLDRLREELDTISMIHPESEGKVGKAESGFQTNLLQEATDSVHAPHIRAHELAIEELAHKFRHLMKMMYDIPRLISITSSDDQVEAFEFSARDIDPNADIIVQAGSGLPTLKSARIQMALELRNARVFGNPDDPEVNRKVLAMLEMGDFGNLYATARRDEERARLENLGFADQRPVAEPIFCDNHKIHYTVHTDQMKSSDFESWGLEAQQALISHLLWHATYINPATAAQIAAIYQLPVPVLPQSPLGATAQATAQAAPPEAPQQSAPGAAASGNQQAIPGGFGPRGTNSM